MENKRHIITWSLLATFIVFAFVMLVFGIVHMNNLGIEKSGYSDMVIRMYLHAIPFIATLAVIAIVWIVLSIFINKELIGEHFLNKQFVNLSAFIMLIGVVAFIVGVIANLISHNDGDVEGIRLMAKTIMLIGTIVFVVALIAVIVLAIIKSKQPVDKKDSIVFSIFEDVIIYALLSGILFFLTAGSVFVEIDFWILVFIPEIPYNFQVKSQQFAMELMTTQIMKVGLIIFTIGVLALAIIIAINGAKEKHKAICNNEMTSQEEARKIL